MMSSSTYRVETVHSSTVDDSRFATILVLGDSLTSSSDRPRASDPSAIVSTPTSTAEDAPSPLPRRRPDSSSQRDYEPLPPPPTPPLAGGALPPPGAAAAPRTCRPQLIATISAGFDKADYLVREERGSNVYFDFFEEAYNFACQKGYGRMLPEEEEDYMAVIRRAHGSVPGGCRYNTGRLIMVLRKGLVPLRAARDDEGGDGEPSGAVMGGAGSGSEGGSSSSSSRDEVRRDRKRLARSANTLPTDSESSGPSTAYSSASTSYVDSWE